MRHELSVVAFVSFGDEATEMASVNSLIAFKRALQMRTGAYSQWSEVGQRVSPIGQYLAFYIPASHQSVRVVVQRLNERLKP
jgi:hypothetical protein